jgi:hypothetical protein
VSISSGYSFPLCIPSGCMTFYRYHVLVPDPCCQAIVLFFTSRNGLWAASKRSASVLLPWSICAIMQNSYMFHILFVSILLRNFPVNLRSCLLQLMRLLQS